MSAAPQTIRRILGALALTAGLAWAEWPYLLTTIAGAYYLDGIGDGGPAQSAFISAHNIAFDGAGNLYLAGLYRVRRIDAAGVIRSVAGRSGAAREPDGDGGPALFANMSPAGLAVLPDGTFYLGDQLCRCVRRVGSDGLIQTVAGNGQFGWSGDGGPATLAQLEDAGMVSADGAGNVYIAGTSRIRVLKPDGTIGFFMGSVSGNALEVRGLATDAAGNLYISADDHVWKATAERKVSALGPALDHPGGLAVDAAGNIYVAESGKYRIRRITPAGEMTTVAGNGARGSSGDGGPALAAQMIPAGVALDPAGNLYINETTSIRMVGPDGLIRPVAGSPSQHFAGDGGPAVQAALNLPGGVAAAPDGSLYVADSSNHRIRRITPDGTIRTIAGSGPVSDLYTSARQSGGYSGDGGPATAARLSSPAALALDQQGNLYIAERGNHVVRKLAPSGIITTVAGSGVAGYYGDGGPATSAELNDPTGVAVDAAGNLYIAEGGSIRIRKVTPQGLITTIAGTGECCTAGDGGPATQARMYAPSGVAVDAAGNVFVADQYRIRKVDAAGVITTVAQHTAAVTALAFDAAGNLYATAPGEVLRLGADGKLVRIAGQGSPLLGGDSGPALAAFIGWPNAVAADAAGNVYFTDSRNHLVRKLEPAQIFPRAVVNAATLQPDFVAPGEIVTIYGVDLGTNPRVWFDDLPAPVLYASPTQINSIVPFAVPAPGGTRLHIEYTGGRTNTIGLAVRPASPGIFAGNALGHGLLSIFATGTGALHPPLRDGESAADSSHRNASPLSVEVAGHPAEVLFAGATPGLLPGVTRIDARLPPDLPPRFSIRLTVAGATSPEFVVEALSAARKRR